MIAQINTLLQVEPEWILACKISFISKYVTPHTPYVSFWFKIGYLSEHCCVLMPHQSIQSLYKMCPSMTGMLLCNKLTSSFLFPPYFMQLALFFAWLSKPTTWNWSVMTWMWIVTDESSMVYLLIGKMGCVGGSPSILHQKPQPMKNQWAPDSDPCPSCRHCTFLYLALQRPNMLIFKIDLMPRSAKQWLMSQSFFCGKTLVSA